MEKRIISIHFYQPTFEDLWFKQAMAANQETVCYTCESCYAMLLLQDKWEKWYELWVNNPDKRFYRYITTGKSRSFVGDVLYFYDEQQEIWLAAISICGKYRGQGYESAALRLLCAAAKEAGIPEKDIKNWNFVK